VETRCENAKEGDYLEYIGVDVRIILKLLQDGRLRIGVSCEH
jgi:hypothetical protein